MVYWEERGYEKKGLGMLFAEHETGIADRRDKEGRVASKGCV